MAAKKKQDFEATLLAIEQSVSKLESSNLPLEEGLKTFEQGMSDIKHCQQLLEQAEKKINTIMQPVKQDQDSY
jgi:exodeoxyribonuclease VII small subunit